MYTLEDWIEDINRQISEVEENLGLTRKDISKLLGVYKDVAERNLAESKAKMYLRKEYHYMVEDIKDIDSFTEWIKAGMHPKDFWIIEKHNFPVELAIMLKR